MITTSVFHLCHGCFKAEPAGRNPSLAVFLALANGRLSPGDSIEDGCTKCSYQQSSNKSHVENDGIMKSCFFWD